MSTKIIYFTADQVPTAQEVIDIANLNSLNTPTYDIKVRNAKVSAFSPDYGAGKEDCDYVAVTSGGTVPTAYNAKSTYNPGAVPAGGILNGGNITVKNSAESVTKTGVATVSAGSLTQVKLAATEAIVTNGATPTISDASGGTVAATAVVSAGVVASQTIASTAKIIKSTVQCPCPAPTGTRVTGYVFTIVNGAITAAVGY